MRTKVARVSNLRFNKTASWKLAPLLLLSLCLTSAALGAGGNYVPPGAGGGVSSVSGTAPIVSSGGATPAISIVASTGSVPGSMSAADKTKLDGISGTFSGLFVDLNFTGADTSFIPDSTGRRYVVDNDSVSLSQFTVTGSGATQLSLGINTSAAGKLKLFGATSGNATIQPPAVAGSSITITLPNAASVLPIFGQQITFAGPTAARTITLPDTSFTVNDATTLSGATLASNVLASSLTSTGTLTGGATGAGFTIALTTSTVTGTLPAARLPNPTSSTLGGIESYAAVSNQWINAISTSGVPSSAQPAFTDVSGVLADSQSPALPGDGVAPTVAKYVKCLARKSSIDLKTAATSSIFTVPASKTFVCTDVVAVVDSVTSAGAGTETFKIVESGASKSMSSNTASASGTPAVGTYYSESATPNGAPYTGCAAGNIVQIVVTTSQAGSTAVSGTVYVFGFYY